MSRASILLESVSGVGKDLDSKFRAYKLAKKRAEKQTAVIATLFDTIDMSKATDRAKFRKEDAKLRSAEDAQSKALKAYQAVADKFSA